MKVAYLFSRYAVPSQTFCDTEMRALEAAGFEVEIYSCSPPTSAFRHGADDRSRGPVFYAPPGNALEWVETAARHDGRWPADLVADHETRYGPRYDPARRAQHAVYFADLMRRRGVEHLHVHFANRATHAALFIHALTGLPFSFTVHAQDFLVDLGNDELLAEMCARAAFVVTVSDWSRRALIERCPETASKIRRIYNGLPLDRWPTPIRGASDNAGAGQIFSVGRLVAFKGFDDLIAACAGLKARAIPFQCEIAGEGPLRGALEKRIDELGVGDCVRLTGLLPQAEIRTRMAACDVFALACRVDEKGACDVLPTVILEAMAGGRPVVSTRLAGVPEMVEDERTGRQVAPGDVPALTAALDDLLRDPAGRERLGQAGRRKLEDEFSSAATTRELAALFVASQKQLAPLVPSIPSATGPRTICLFDRWPAGHEGGGDAALLTWRERNPDLRLAALTMGAPPAGTAARAETLALVGEFEFLPDAMVQEGVWRERAGDAHRIESWRGGVGGGSLVTEEFLLAARRALFLHRHWEQLGGAGSAHLYAVGARAVWCAWILLRLGAVQSASFFLAAGEVGGTGMPGSSLRRLAAGFQGGCVEGERKLATSLGPDFHADASNPVDWFLGRRAGIPPAA